MTPKRRGTAWAVMASLAAAAWATPGWAADVPPALLGAACSTCHGPGGRSPGAIPSIDGLGTDAIRTSLLGFKRGELPATIMDRISKGFSDTEIDALASWLGRKSP